MANIKININKTTGSTKEIIEEKDIVQEMNGKVEVFCKFLLKESKYFGEKEAFDTVLEYISLYERISYAQISNTIYACYNEHTSEESAKLISTLNTNIIRLVNYSKSEEISKRIQDEKIRLERNKIKDTQKAILKIWDHINLAQQQYNALKQSDEEYERKFNEKIKPVKDNLVKEMNAQLLTMIGIFTALAFLIFGGISSLENVFSNPQLPLFKLMIIGCVWGLCILNLVFVFLFCVGKMTNLNFKSDQDENATIFQKYPIVWWSNLVIVATMVFSMWGYYLTKKEIHNWFDKICLNHPKSASIVGTVIIVSAFAIIAFRLAKATKCTNEKKN